MLRTCTCMWPSISRVVCLESRTLISPRQDARAKSGQGQGTLPLTSANIIAGVAWQGMTAVDQAAGTWSRGLSLNYTKQPTYVQ